MFSNEEWLAAKLLVSLARKHAIEEAINRRPALFEPGEFTSHSGLKLNGKFECDSLTKEDWDTLALWGSKILPPFDVAFPVPPSRAGHKDNAKELSGRMNTHYRRGHGYAFPVLVCDDVLTTGSSLLAEMEKIKKNWQGAGVIGLVAFARGPLPENVYSISNWSV